MENENKTAVRAFFDAVNRRDLDSVRRMVDPGFVDHFGPTGGTRGVEAFIDLFGMITSAFPDLHVAVEDAIAEGDRVAVRLTVSGTHQGVLMGTVEPTGRRAAWDGMDLIRFEDGRMVERWGLRDIFGLMAQLEGRA